MCDWKDEGGQARRGPNTPALSQAVGQREACWERGAVTASGLLHASGWQAVSFNFLVPQFPHLFNIRFRIAFSNVSPRSLVLWNTVKDADLHLQQRSLANLLGPFRRNLPEHLPTRAQASLRWSAEACRLLSSPVLQTLTGIFGVVSVFFLFSLLLQVIYLPSFYQAFGRQGKCWGQESSWTSTSSFDFWELLPYQGLGSFRFLSDTPVQWLE